MAAKFETLLPRVPTRLGVLPLFVIYIFVLIAEGAVRQRINKTLGVIALIRFARDEPANVPESEILALKARMDPATGLIRLPPLHRRDARLRKASGCASLAARSKVLRRSIQVRQRKSERSCSSQCWDRRVRSRCRRIWLCRAKAQFSHAAPMSAQRCQ